MITLSHDLFASELKLRLGDRVSIYSEKVYTKHSEKYFEAVGNVVILSGQETLYGEKASVDMKEGKIDVEGNVRFISKNVTIYGAKIHFNSQTEELEVFNARILTPEFSIVANELKRVEKGKYFAKEAEFSTCTDCVESWSVFGSEIEVELSQYVKISHAFIKAKEVNVLYLPYVIFPIKNKRESGLLFPKLSSLSDEGIHYEQPFFWAISDDKDFTFTPLFLGRRGQGSDLEYRQQFSRENWMKFNTRFIEDSLYADKSSYFRTVVEWENHYEWSHNTRSHFRLLDVKEIDFFDDFSEFTEDKLQGADAGFSGFLEHRQNNWTMGTRLDVRKNLFYRDAEKFDPQYVNLFPQIYFSLKPQSLYTSNTLLLRDFSFGLDSQMDVFRQEKPVETNYLRNAMRVDFAPYMNWSLIKKGPYKLKTKTQLFYDQYHLLDSEQSEFYKNATLFSTEFSFQLSRIFGLAFHENIPVSNLTDESKERLLEERESSKPKEDQRLIGHIPRFSKQGQGNYVTKVAHSYRHLQNFRFIHHRILSEGQGGNEGVGSQIEVGGGQFDYRDGILSKILESGDNETRLTIPKSNTFEFQWDHSIIKKSARNSTNYIEDGKFLRDNFSYAEIAHFSISQGVLLDTQSENWEDDLTRLHINGKMKISGWNFGFDEYFFHQTREEKLDVTLTKRFSFSKILAKYSESDVGETDSKTLEFGMQFLPVDTLGFSLLKEYDWISEESISTIYQVDIMPHNNCWLLNFNYKDGSVESRYAVNFIFNFGSETFNQYRQNFWSFTRL